MSSDGSSEHLNVGEARLKRLLEVGRELVAELDLDTVLNRLLEVARDLTDARYGAIGVLDAERTRLERFLTSGVDAATHAAVGDLPRGRGVLGLLIEDPWPLRVADVAAHPESYGFPVGHPRMTSFLGVPVVIRGQVWGNLYLTEKDGGGFTQDDEDVVVALAAFAGVAVDNARQLQLAERRRDEHEAAARRLEAAQTIALAVGAESDLGRILELIVKRGRALLRARSVLILLEDGDELVVSAAAGDTKGAHGARVPIAGSTSGAVMATGQPVRVSEAESEFMMPPSALGVPDAHGALLTPLIYRGRSLGVLAAFNRTGSEESSFSDEDEQVLRAFAASAATAVATAQEFSSKSLRLSLESAEQERSRWARELHDETLQELAALRLMLSGARRSDELEQVHDGIDTAVERLQETITGLRSLITDLRPAALDQLGLAPALDALAARTRATTSLEVELKLALPDEDRLSPAIEIAVYRLVQEALTNAVKHSSATRAAVEVVVDSGHVVITVRDEGAGFNPAEVSSGFGLVGMRERIALVGGKLEVDSRPGEGTTVRVEIPVLATSIESG